MKTIPSRSKFHLYAAAASAAIGSSQVADAQFAGDYDLGVHGGYYLVNAVALFGNWTGSGTALAGLGLVTSTTQIEIGYNGYVSPSSHYAFTIPAVASSNVSFDFSISASGDGYTGYLVNGAFNNFSGASGTVNYTIGAGDVFGFKIGSNYNTGGFGSGTASITITNFSVTAVPEPGTTTLLAGCAALGFVGLLARRERRRRMAVVPA